MIFVTLGTERFQFPRLCKYIDKVIQEKKIKEHIFVQTGTTQYNFRPSEYLTVTDYINYTKYTELINKANKVIIHAGVGSFLDVVSRGKVPIIVPRKPELQEHLDDQQIQLAKVLEQEFHAPVAYNYKEFIKLLSKDNNNIKVKHFKAALVKFLDDWVKKGL